ncbi:MAG: ABC transporter substrate-binding protein [Burkholderiales bacterium]
MSALTHHHFGALARDLTSPVLKALIALSAKLITQLSAIGFRAASLAVLLAVASLLATAPAAAQEKVVFAINWKAESSQGGFYQALVDGTYKRYGLDVEIRQGGPQVNNRPLLSAGRIDFLLTGNLLHSFDNVRNKVPTIVVASMFQKDPQALITYPGQYATWDDLKKAPVIFIAKDAQYTWWQWMKSLGFDDNQLKPYTYSSAPFLANKRSVQQGYITAEPIAIEKAAGFVPKTFLLSDNGWSTYANTIEARTETVKNKPEMVRKFVEASIIGWVNYLHGDRSAANAMIRKENPEMTQDELDRGVALLRQLGIVDSGDSLTRGIGAIDPARIRDFYDKMVKAGLYKAGEVDLSQVATTEFINKGAGVELRTRLTATGK